MAHRQALDGTEVLKDTPTDAEKIRRLPWTVAGDTANALFTQLTIFGSAFILFLSELGLPKTEIGLTMSLLPFCGLIALFVAPLVARAGFKRDGTS